MIQPVLSEKLADQTSLRHGFFTREGGVSEGAFSSLNCSLNAGDVPEHVSENRRRVAQTLGVGAESLVGCKQVHSARAVLVDRAWSVEANPEADALVTTQKGIALGILTADCAPVLLADAQAGVIAAAHAGWRGALDGVLEATLELMASCGATREHIIAAVGPCIWQESYEVGADFSGPFAREDQANKAFFTKSENAGHLQFDLPGYVAAKLTRLGVGLVSPSQADTTRDEARFYSHRRGVLRGMPETGRMLSCIMMNGS